MLLTQVALVPYDEELLRMDELLHVAAALQTQVTRDLSPLWGVSGCVSPFRSLDDVPVGYMPLAIVQPETLPDQAHAFHLSTRGQPLGLVAYRQGWSLLASHELLEMLCDPWGKLSAPGVRKDHGHVEYLVEVCDPCQYQSYSINGVLVSDFVTPKYYDDVENQGVRYSFTGSVKRPLQILAGGYLSWTSIRDGKLWQAFGEVEPPVPLDVAPQFSREWVDSHPGTGAPELTNQLVASRVADPCVLGDSAYGAALKTDIGRNLKPAPPAKLPVNRDAFLALVYKLGNDPGYYDHFTKMSSAAKLQELSNLNIATDDLTEETFPTKIPTMAEYQQIFDDLSEGKSFGPAIDKGGTGKRLMSLGAFTSPPAARQRPVS